MGTALTHKPSPKAVPGTALIALKPRREARGTGGGRILGGDRDLCILAGALAKSNDPSPYPYYLCPRWQLSIP